jgi:hypothetical protein
LNNSIKKIEVQCLYVKTLPMDDSLDTFEEKKYFLKEALEE